MAVAGGYTQAELDAVTEPGRYGHDECKDWYCLFFDQFDGESADRVGLGVDSEAGPDPKKRKGADGSKETDANQGVGWFDADGIPWDLGDTLPIHLGSDDDEDAETQRLLTATTYEQGAKWGHSP